jgi:hypothetical protein
MFWEDSFLLPPLLLPPRLGRVAGYLFPFFGR